MSGLVKMSIVKESLKYSYDQNGNIIKIFENGELIQNFEYDGISRLIRENNKKLNKTTTFEYDAGGNIFRKIEYGYTTVATNNLSGGTIIPYTYPTSGWRDQLLSYNYETIEYDTLGNPLTYRNNNLSWSHGRQLDSFNDITYKYNADGVRTSKTVNNVTTQYYLDGTKILAQSDGNMLSFHYGSEGVIGFTYQGVGEYYYKKNIFGDVIGIIDNNGKEITKYIYDAWGNHKTFVFDNGQFVDISTQTSYTQSGLNNKTIALLNPFRYRSYYYDVETGLYYLNSRYYNPEIGRFINADDISILSEGKDFFNGLNLYAYCSNNPISNTDTSGEKWWEWLIIALVAVVVVVATVAITIATGGIASTMLIGAGIGAIMGGTTSAISQLASGQGFNVGEFFLSIAFGAITGLIGGSALGVFGSALAMGATSFVQSMASDLVTTGSVNYGKAALNGVIGAALGANAGAQNGLTSQRNALQSSMKNISQKIANGGYSLRGGKGALNLVEYQLKKATNILKIRSFSNLIVSLITSDLAGEEIFKYLTNSIF